MRAEGAGRTVAEVYADCANWHAAEALKLRRRREEMRRWSEEHNDGNPNLGGTFAEVDVPIMVRVHDQAERHFRRLAARAKRRAALAALESEHA